MVAGTLQKQRGRSRGADPDGPWNLSLEWGCRQVEGPGMATFWDPQTRCRGPGCGNFVGGRREGEA